jgi:hypothetical protein
VENPFDPLPATVADRIIADGVLIFTGQITAAEIYLRLLCTAVVTTIKEFYDKKPVWLLHVRHTNLQGNKSY